MSNKIPRFDAIDPFEQKYPYPESNCCAIAAHSAHVHPVRRFQKRAFVEERRYEPRTAAYPARDMTQKSAASQGRQLVLKGVAARKAADTARLCVAHVFGVSRTASPCTLRLMGNKRSPNPHIKHALHKCSCTVRKQATENKR